MSRLNGKQALAIILRTVSEIKCDFGAVPPSIVFPKERERERETRTGLVPEKIICAVRPVRVRLMLNGSTPPFIMVQ